jgi:hypothetical protein
MPAFMLAFQHAADTMLSTVLCRKARTRSLRRYAAAARGGEQRPRETSSRDMFLREDCVFVEDVSFVAVPRSDVFLLGIEYFSAPDGVRQVAPSRRVVDADIQRS